MTLRSSKRMPVLCLFALGAWSIAACGGRFRDATVSEDDDSTSVAGRSNSGGASAAGRGGSSVGRAGAPGAGAPGAGAGGVSCNNVNCAMPKCPAGSMLITPSGTCCPVCSPCACPGIACGPGYHFETVAGACCPTCVPDTNPSCMMGRQAYQSIRQSFLDKYSFGCASSAECRVVPLFNRCEQCGYGAIWYGSGDNFASNLANAAQMDCSTCPPQEPEPCVAPPMSAVCANNRCIIFDTLQ